MAEIEVLPLLAAERSRATSGAISELRACAYLMTAGYFVYRCESPHAPFDLVAYKDGTCLRVEVKTVSIKREVYAPAFGWPANDHWDLLVVVGEDRVFCFDSCTPRDHARDVIRAHYGFSTGPVVPWNKKSVMAKPA